MPRPVPQPSDDVTVYLVLNDHGKNGIAYAETDPAEADLETTIQNFLTGRYENALRVIERSTPRRVVARRFGGHRPGAFARAINAGDNLGEGRAASSSTDMSTPRAAGATRARSKCSTVSKRILTSGHRHPR